MRVSTEVVARRIEDTVVLVHLGSDQIYSLNVTGARLWELLSEGLDPAAIAQQLILEFDVDERTVREEVSRLTTDLLFHGLLLEDVDG